MRHKLRVLGAVVVAAAVFAAFAAAASSPSVQTGPASAIKNTSATLHGTVNPNGSDTSYFFQWGLTKAYGVNGHTHSAGSGTTSVDAQATPTGLLPGTKYHYRLVAQNRSGVSAGTDRTFTTTGHPPPAVATGPATQIGKSFATLTGVVNPHGANTTWYFQYGTSTAYFGQTAGGTAAAGSSPVVVSSPLQGLNTGTIFHYRLAARHGSFISFGADQTFMTFPRVRPKPRVRARTKPRHAGNKPFVFTTSGSVRGPSWIPAQFACSGNVTIRFFRGRRRVSFILVPVQPNCTYSGQTVFNRKPGSGGTLTLGVVIRFLGNGYLARAKAHHETVLVG
jgi:hypothetical protein